MAVQCRRFNAKIEFFKELSMVEAYKEKAVKHNYLTAGN